MTEPPKTTTCRRPPLSWRQLSSVPSFPLFSARRTPTVLFLFLSAHFIVLINNIATADTNRALVGRSPVDPNGRGRRRPCSMERTSESFPTRSERFPRRSPLRHSRRPQPGSGCGKVGRVNITRPLQVCVKQMGREEHEPHTERERGKAVLLNLVSDHNHCGRCRAVGLRSRSTFCFIGGGGFGGQTGDLWLSVPPTRERARSRSCSPSTQKTLMYLAREETFSLFQYLFCNGMRGGGRRPMVLVLFLPRCCRTRGA